MGWMKFSCSLCLVASSREPMATKHIRINCKEMMGSDKKGFSLLWGLEENETQQTLSELSKAKAFKRDLSYKSKYVCHIIQELSMHNYWHLCVILQLCLDIGFWLHFSSKFNPFWVKNPDVKISSCITNLSWMEKSKSWNAYSSVLNNRPHLIICWN